MSFFDAGDHIRLLSKIPPKTGQETWSLIKDQYEGRTFHVVKPRMTISCTCGHGHGSMHTGKCAIKRSSFNPQMLKVREIESELSAEWFELVPSETFDSAPPPAAA